MTQRWKLTQIQAAPCEWQLEESGADQAADEAFEEEEGVMSGGASPLHGATLVLESEGTWRLEDTAEYYGATGVWSQSGNAFDLSLTERGSYARVVSCRKSEKRLSLQVEIDFDVLQNHALGLWTLRFEPAKKASVAIADRIVAAEDPFAAEKIVDDALKKRDAADLMAELWDEIANRAIDEDGYELAVLQQSVEHAAGREGLPHTDGFTHQHALMWVSRVSPEHSLVNNVAACITALPADPDGDVRLSDALRTQPGWLEPLAQHVQFDGVEVDWSSGRFPQPEMNDVCRDRMTRGTVGRFDEFERLYEGDVDWLSRTIFRYRGFGLLTKPMALIRELEIEAPVLRATTEFLDDRANTRTAGVWESAVVLCAELSADAGELPGVLLAAVSGDPLGWRMGRLEEDEKARLRERLQGLDRGREVLSYLHVT